MRWSVSALGSWSELRDEILKELEGLIARIRDHPYLARLERGEVGREGIGAFTKEQYHIITTDLRSFALFASKARSPIARGLFLDAIVMERRALEALSHLAKEMALSEEDLKRHRPHPKANAFTNYMARLALYGSDGEMLAANLLDLPIWGGNCARMADALRSRYGLPEPSLEFLRLFSEPLPTDFLAKASQVIEEELPENEDGIRGACRLLLEYELMFWDAMEEVG